MSEKKPIKDNNKWRGLTPLIFIAVLILLFFIGLLLGFYNSSQHFVLEVFDIHKWQHLFQFFF